MLIPRSPPRDIATGSEPADDSTFQACIQVTVGENQVRLLGQIGCEGCQRKPLEPGLQADRFAGEGGGSLDCDLPLTLECR